MLIVGVDPGVTTGYAVYRAGPGELVVAGETADAGRVAQLLWDIRPCRPVVAVESFPGGGPRTKEAARTLQVLGFVEGFARWLGLTVLLQHPQKKLHRLDEAVALAGRSPHAADALAHALVAAAALARSGIDPQV